MSKDPNDNTTAVIVSTVFTQIIPMLLRISKVVVGLIGIAGGFLYWKQESLLYFPELQGIARHNKDNPRGYRTPAYHNWPFEEHFIKCSDGVHIHSWLLLGEGAHTNNNSNKQQVNNDTKKLPTILFFHGNAGNIGLRIPNAIQMLLQLERKFNILMVEYRGYGDSDNVQPTEKGLQLDAHAAIHFCINHPLIDSTNAGLFFFGRSLGGSVAFHAAQYAKQHNIKIGGVIVENTFLSISSMVDLLMPKIIVLLKPFVLRMKWDSEKIVPTLNDVPVLYLAGKKDELVPHSQIQQLYQLSRKVSDNVKIHVVPDGTHNDTWMVGGQEYWDAFRSFLFGILSLQSDNGGGIGAAAEAAWGTTSATTTTESSSAVLPTMSSNLFGIAKDAISSSSGADKDKDL